METTGKLPLEALLPPELSEGMTPAEKTLLHKAEKGELADFLTGKEDEDDQANAPKWGPERMIRSEFLFWLCTDASAVDRVHPKGVRISGAVIPTKLDFAFCTLPHPLALESCAVPGGFDFEGAHMRFFSLVASTSGPVFCHRLQNDGNFILQLTNIDGQVRLLGATIKGDLDCRGASLKNAEGYALSADRIAVEGDVFLRDDFQAEGEVCLLGATIKGDLDCRGASLKNAEGYAFCCENAVIKGTIFFLPLQLEGSVDLLHAEVGQLLDDPESWPKRGNLYINGFTYSAFAGNAATVEVNKRLKWLALQPDSPFSPQPYEQLAKVYRSMGLERDAKKVLIAKQEALRQHGELGKAAKAWNWILGKCIGHGYKSWRLLLYGIIPLILLGWGVFWCAERRDVMQSTEDNPSEFNAFVYSLDTFLPLVKLHQEEFWLPTTSKTYGSYYRLYLWIHIGLGWLLTTLFVVSLTGVVKKE